MKLQSQSVKVKLNLNRYEWAYHIGVCSILYWAVRLLLDHWLTKRINYTCIEIWASYRQFKRLKCNFWKLSSNELNLWGNEALFLYMVGMFKKQLLCLCTTISMGYFVRLEPHKLCTLLKFNWFGCISIGVADMG